MPVPPREVAPISGTWASGFITGDVVTAAEFRKGAGALFDTTLSVAAASIDITGIISDYAHLKLEIVARGDTAALEANVALRFNNDSGANYNRQGHQATNATVTAAGSINNTSLIVGTMPAATAPANAAATIGVKIGNYTGTTFFKAVRARAAWENADTAAGQSLSSTGGTWKATPAAVNRITVLALLGNFAVGTRVTLYGEGA
jgi:hypothetical protein